MSSLPPLRPQNGRRGGRISIPTPSSVGPDDDVSTVSAASTASTASTVDWRRGADKRRRGGRQQRSAAGVSVGVSDGGVGGYRPPTGTIGSDSKSGRRHAAPAPDGPGRRPEYDPVERPTVAATTTQPIPAPAVPISRPAGRRQRRSSAREVEAGVLGCLLVVTLAATLTLFGALSSSSTDSGGWFEFGGGGAGGPNERRAVAALRLAEDRYPSWPASVRDEEADFEFMRHPGGAFDGQGRPVELAVPRFYASDGIDGNSDGDGIGAGSFFGGKRLTRRVADMVGTYVTQDGRASGNVDARTIFVSVASYRDGRCRDTVESIFARATHPERLRLGIVDQIESTDPSCDVPIRPCETSPDQALCKYHHQIDVYEVEATLAVGPTFARHISQRLYRGEYYVLYVDADTTFVTDWDRDVVDAFETTGDEMAVLTTYLFDAEDNVDETTGEPVRHSRYLICNAGFVGAGHDRRLRHDVSEQPEGTPHVRGSPQLQPYWSAGFSFSRGHFALIVQYDPHLAMIERADEEISIAIRAFTHGYDFFAPERNVCFRGSPTPLTGDEPSDAVRKVSFKEHADKYRGKHASSLSRLLALVDMGTDEEWDKFDEDKYGMGAVRASSKFFTCFGIHVAEKITERKLCDFVSSGMLHNKFLEKLRSDGMGIDYDEIIFRFHELLRVHENI